MAAWLASRAVVLTTSPSAVKSLTTPSVAVEPTKATPVCDAGADGDRAGRRDVAASGPSEQGPAGRDGRGRVVFAADATEEQPDDLVADELVDDAVAGQHDL